VYKYKLFVQQNHLSFIVSNRSNPSIIDPLCHV
jgi:hypothetical protein